MHISTNAWLNMGGKDFTESVNPKCFKVVTAFVEPSLAKALPDQKFRFERRG